MDEIRAVLAEVARLDRERVELRGRGDAGCVGNALRLARHAPHLAAALEVAVEDLEREFPCTCHGGWTERGMHGKECAWDAARDILSRIAAALTGEEAP